MRTLIAIFLVIAALSGSITARAQPPAETASAELVRNASAFTHTGAADWLNSAPLEWQKLRGKVVLIDFWTFACSNCVRSFPWLNAVEDRYDSQGLVLIGVHTPELPQERVRGNVVKKVAEYKLRHPVMIDEDYSYWNALGNRYWPAYYLIDKRGRIRDHFVGEVHPNDPLAVEIEAAVKSLLAEKI